MVGLEIIKDTFSPRLKEIEKDIIPTSILAVQEAHEEYVKIQTPLVPVGESDEHSIFYDDHAGLLLSSMADTQLLTFGEEAVGMRFGFYAYDDINGWYAKIQEEEYPRKHQRYSKHRPTIYYFEEGIQFSKKKMKKKIDERFKLILK